MDYIPIIHKINNHNINIKNSNNYLDKKPIEIFNNNHINNNLDKNNIDISINSKNKKDSNENFFDIINNLKNKLFNIIKGDDNKNKSINISNNIKNNLNNKNYEKKTVDIYENSKIKNINYIIDNDNNKDIHVINNDNKNNINKNNQIIKSICIICGDAFIPTEKNTIKNCGHSFCNNCWYHFLEIKIKENQLTTIKCLDYNCKEKLSDDFIFKFLKNNKYLMEKYRKFKLELEIINDPNKKPCPFPNCSSYLELKDKNNKYINCLNGHTFCFVCQQEPHGEKPCDQIFDSNIKEYALNKFIKKCPNCGIITEKDQGCNHMVCSKCQYQWCWLCNEEYKESHFLEGKCKGLQFFNPKDEYDINMAFEGKIDLNESQFQNSFDLYYLEDRIPGIIRPDFIERISSNEGGSSNDNFNNGDKDTELSFPHLYVQSELVNSFQTSLCYLLIYLFLGHFILSSKLSNSIFFRLVLILLTPPYFILFFALNIIMLPIYLLNDGFNSFINDIKFIDTNKETFKTFENLNNLILFLFFGGFIFICWFGNKINNYNKNSFSIKIMVLINIYIAFIFWFVFFPIQFCFNIIYVIFLFLEKCSDFFDKLNELFNKAYVFSS